MAEFVRVPTDGAGKRLTTKDFDDSGTAITTQVMHVGDRSDPNIQQTVDNDGAAFVKFPTGTPSFNAFNRLITTSDNLLSAFKFYEGAKAVGDKVDTATTGTATVGPNAANLSYKSTVSPGAGNKAVLSSHRRFSYKPGASVTTYFVVSTNNPSQPNLTMRAGKYDDDDGMFFEIENGIINVVIRNSVTGTPVETKIPQSSWNGDRLDGSGSDNNRSGATLDLTTMNILWVTYQYLSAGAVTFGSYVNGVPVVVHTEGHYGELTAPYMATTYLPHRFEAETTGTGQVGDTDLYTYCSTSISDGYQDLIRTPIGFDATASLTDGTETYVAGFRPAQTYGGVDNRYRYLLEFLSTYSSAEPVLFTLYIGATVTGATWGEQILGLEIDTAGSLTTGHPTGKTITAGGNAGGIETQTTGGDNSTDGLFRKNDITASDIWVVTAKSLTAAATTVNIAGSWAEVQ